MTRFGYLAIGFSALLLPALFIPQASKAQQGGKWCKSLKGQIVWPEGKDIPKREEITQVKANQDKKACLKNGPLFSEEWVINPKNRGVRWTFVWLKPLNGSMPIHPDLKKIKDPQVSMDQPCCMFEPHALAMREGQKLLAKNSSTINHNYKWSGTLVNDGGNILLPPKGSFAIPEWKAGRLPIKITCSIHPWMNGWVRVFDHPYFAVTDEDGKFEIKNAPAGGYALMVWHGSGGWLGGVKGRNGKKIKIPAGETKDLGSLEFK